MLISYELAISNDCGRYLKGFNPHTSRLAHWACHGYGWHDCDGFIEYYASPVGHLHSLTRHLLRIHSLFRRSPFFHTHYATSNAHFLPSGMVGTSRLSTTTKAMYIFDKDITSYHSRRISPIHNTDIAHTTPSLCLFSFSTFSTHLPGRWSYARKCKNHPRIQHMCNRYISENSYKIGWTVCARLSRWIQSFRDRGRIGHLHSRRRAGTKRVGWSL